MTTSFNNFSVTDIHILENGLRWIKEEEETFANNFYHRLLENHLEFNVFLQSIGPWSFGRHLIRSLESLIRDLRDHGEIITPLKDLWPELSGSPLASAEPADMMKVVEIFLDLLSRVAEDAWSPVLEYTWRKAIETVLPGVGKPGTNPYNSSVRSQSISHFFNQESKPLMSQSPMVVFAPMMLIAGGIVGLGLWMRCQLGKIGLKERKFAQFSPCS